MLRHALKSRPCLFDLSPAAGRFQMDPSGVTSRGGHNSHAFASWSKSQDGRVVNHDLTFTSTAAKATDDDEDERPAAAASWTHGKVTVNVHAGGEKCLSKPLPVCSDPRGLLRPS